MAVNGLGSVLLRTTNKFAFVADCQPPVSKFERSHWESGVSKRDLTATTPRLRLHPSSPEEGNTRKSLATRQICEIR